MTELKKRKYNNTLRAQKSDHTTVQIIETYVHMLAAAKGSEVQIQDLALKAKVSERTIFRFFKDKKALHEATDSYIQRYLQSSLQLIEKNSFLGFVQKSFLLFEEHHDLMLAYMFSPYGIKARTVFRKQLNEILISQILKEKKLKLSKQNKHKLSVIVSLVNVKIWYDLKNDFKMTSPEISQSMSWAIESLLDQLS